MVCACFWNRIRIFTRIETSNQTPIVDGATQCGLQPFYVMCFFWMRWTYWSITIFMNQEFTGAKFRQRIVCLRLRCGHGHLATWFENNGIRRYVMLCVCNISLLKNIFLYQNWYVFGLGLHSHRGQSLCLPWLRSRDRGALGRTRKTRKAPGSTTRETNEPECNHVKHFCILLWNKFFLQISHCYLTSAWKVEGFGMPSVECEESGLLSGTCSPCRVWTVNCVMCSVKFCNV